MEVGDIVEADKSIVVEGKRTVGVDKGIAAEERNAEEVVRTGLVHWGLSKFQATYTEEECFGGA